MSLFNPNKLIIHDTCLIRIPCFPTTALLTEEFEQLKEKIKDSSPEFYQQICNLDISQLGVLPLSKRYTLWKYFNRSKYRATPYGYFAGVCLHKLDDEKSDTRLIISEEQIAHQFPDWTLQPSKTDNLNLKETDIKLFANSTWYIVNQDIRYISQQEGKHQVSSIAKNSTIIKLLRICQTPAPYSLLKRRLIHTGYTEQQIGDLIRSLLSCQLLISSQQPNVIGKEYFSRVAFKQSPGPSYTICEHRGISGNLSLQLFREIPPMVRCLHALLPEPHMKDLESFVAKFQLRFGESEVPIMRALDPETGVGYGKIADVPLHGQLFKRLKETTKVSAERPIEQLKKAIMKRPHCPNDPKSTSLNLKTINITFPDPVKEIPNTFSMLISVAGNNLIVDAAGGCTANSLLGRFTLIGKKYLDNCIQLANIEQAANLGVLFFDVGYTSEGRIDNVNRREEIYRRQLNIHNYDTSSDPLNINDIMISVKNQQLIMRSKTLNKRLVPRMASAYNAERSDLPLFRLLSDVQHQGIQSSLTLNIQSLLPDLPFYPRITYGSVILSPAKWRIDRKIIESQTSVSAARRSLTSMGINRYFKAGNADQTLCFDLLDQVDMEMFIHYHTKHKAFYIWEGFNEENSIVKDNKGQPYLPQILLSLYHSGLLYQPIGSSAARKKFVPQRDIIAPGKEWTYFEIYAHPSHSDNLINGVVQNLLKLHKGQILNWHFVRYNEAGDHLRLRIRLKDHANGQKLTNDLTGLLKNDLESGTVSELLIRTYKRETARYSGNRIEDIEDHFWEDSKLVISLLTSGLSIHQIYRVVLQNILSILSTGSIQKMHYTAIIETSCANFSKEYQLNGLGYKAINADYREFIVTDYPQLTLFQQQNAERYVKSFLSVLIKCKITLRPKLFTDLLHMHFNRLFNTNQRQHEMVFYQFLAKFIKATIER